MSRHREGVDLHYGRDDFADHDRLAATLSRERGKDMASDYARASTVQVSRVFAERRNIHDQHDTQAPKRNMFDGLRLRRSNPTPSLDPSRRLAEQACHRCTRPCIRAWRCRGPPWPHRPGHAACAKHWCAVHTGAASRIAHQPSVARPFAPQASQDLERAMACDLRLIGETHRGARQQRSEPCSLKPRCATILRSAPMSLSSAGRRWNVSGPANA